MLDLFAGRLGWSKAFLARGWEVVAVDLIEPPEIPAGLRFIKCDVLEIFYDAHHSAEAFCIAGEPFQPDFACASSPCEEFSVHGMPHFHPNPPFPETGLRLFNHTRTELEKSGVPYVMENVRPAQKFVGKADHHCGPFYLWGNSVPLLMPQGIKKGFQTGGTIIQKLKRVDRQALTDYRRQNDGSWSSSKSAKRKEWTAKAATIPPELAACVAEYADRITEDRAERIRAQLDQDSTP